MRPAWLLDLEGLARFARRYLDFSASGKACGVNGPGLRVIAGGGAAAGVAVPADPERFTVTVSVSELVLGFKWS